MSQQYTASKNNPAGPRLPVENRRTGPQDASLYVIRQDTLEVGAYAPDYRLGITRLYERPLTAQSGQNLIVLDTSTNKSMTPTLTIPPTATAFYVNPNHGCLYFASSMIGKKVVVTYTGIGSIVDAEDINWLYNHAKSVFPPYQETVHLVKANSGINFPLRAVTRVYRVFENEGYSLLNPAGIEGRVYNYDNIDAYFSTVRNVTSEDMKVLVHTQQIPSPAR